VRILVSHDKKGNIKSFVIPAAEFARDLEVEADAGETVTAVDAPDVDAAALARIESDPIARSRVLRETGAKLAHLKVDVRGKKLVNR
jgi:hypothetical protein